MSASETQAPDLTEMAALIAETRAGMVELALAYEQLTEEKRRLARAIRELVDMRLLNPQLLAAVDGGPHAQTG
jgi:hypothetical protein